MKNLVHSAAAIFVLPCLTPGTRGRTRSAWLLTGLAAAITFAFALAPGARARTHAQTPVVTTDSANATENVAFTYQIMATNRPKDYGADDLPAGLQVDATTGVISGTPTVAGTFTFRIGASNAAGTGYGTLTLTILGPPDLSANVNNSYFPDPAEIADGVVGETFSYQIQATNNPTNYGADNLPPGLMVDANTGLITGTPTTAGQYTVTLGAANAGGNAEVQVDLTIDPPAPVFTSVGKLTGRVGVPFAAQVMATNAIAFFTETQMPPGLQMDGSGLITGTPTQAGTYNDSSPSNLAVVIQANDRAGATRLDLDITIAPAYPGYTLPAFFNQQIELFGGAFYLPGFGYYTFTDANPHIIYHNKLGFEYAFDTGDSSNGIVFFDFASEDYLYTSASFPLPALFDFTFDSVIYPFNFKLDDATYDSTRAFGGALQFVKEPSGVTFYR